MWAHYKGTFLRTQVAIVWVTCAVFLAAEDRFPEVGVFFAALQIGAVLSAMWGVGMRARIGTTIGTMIEMRMRTMMGAMIGTMVGTMMGVTEPRGTRHRAQPWQRAGSKLS